jgi:putative ABC transport system substrate-binding protein
MGGPVSTSQCGHNRPFHRRGQSPVGAVLWLGFHSSTRCWVMDRRTFIIGVAYVFVGSPHAARAQEARRLPVVGVLATTSTPQSASMVTFQQGLRNLGYVDGENIVVQLRSALGKPEVLPVIAAEIVHLKPDVLYAVGPAAVRAARDATATIPIVALDFETDPVQSGWVSSFARPGGNVTGLFVDLPGLAGKWLELLSQAVPGVRRVGLLWDSTAGPSQLVAAKAAAQGFAIDVQVLEVRTSDDLDVAFKAAASGSSKAIVMLSSPIVEFNSRHIAELTTKHRLPAISMFRLFTDSGGLMSYGPNLAEFRLRAAGYVDKILKGAKPADLPIEQPTKFEFVINLKTAKALELTIPQSLLLRADEVIH